MAGTSPFRGGFAGSAAKRLPLQRELSAVRLTEGKLFCWGICCRCGRAYLPPFAPRMVPLLLQKEARRWTEAVCQLSDRPRHSFGSLTFELVSYPTLAGRGGSVSRRDHYQVYRKIPPLSGGTNSDESYPVQRQPLFGREGSGGRGASLREAASPPRISRSSPSPLLAQIVLCFADLGDGGVAEGRELKGLGLRRKG